MNRVLRKAIVPFALLGIFLIDAIENWQDRRAIRRYQKRKAKATS
jgi:hypothetical protein